MDAPAGGGQGGADSDPGRCRRGRAGLGRSHAPGGEPRQGPGQAARRRRRDGPGGACEHRRLADASPPLHDRRREARLQLERAQPAFHRLGPLPALDPLGGHRHDRRHRRHLGLAAGGDTGGVLGRASRDRNRASARARHPPPGRRRGAGRRPNTPPRTCPTRSGSRAGAGPTSGRASPGSKRTASGPASASTSPTCCARATPRPSRASMSSGQITRSLPAIGTASPGASASTSLHERPGNTATKPGTGQGQSAAVARAVR